MNSHDARDDAAGSRGMRSVEPSSARETHDSFLHAGNGVGGVDGNEDSRTESLFDGCGVETVCPRCGSQSLASIKCKLICQRCFALVMNCCEF